MLGYGKINLEKMMNKLIYFFLFLLVSLTVKAQFTSEGADLISRFRPGVMWFNTGLRPAEIEKVRKYDRLVFDITYSDWAGESKPFQNKWASLGLNSSIYFDIPMVKNNLVSFGTGLSHSLFTIHHDNQFVTDPTGKYTLYNELDSMLFDKNKLVGNSISIPVEFRFRSKGWKHVKFHIGGKVGYQLNLFQKTQFDGEDGRVIQKSFDIADVNKLNYSVHMRFGIRNWALFGSYNLNGLFKSNESVKLNLLQFGLSLSLY
jgi:hypothetical protein